MNALINILTFSEILLLTYLGISILYFLVFTIASLFYKENHRIKVYSKQKLLVLIPAYKEDAVIVETARSAVHHRSRFSDFEVMVIADSLHPTTIISLQKTGAQVLKVEFDKSTKTKAINKALSSLTKVYDYAVVLDADNMMAPNFMDNIIQELNRGYPIVQGHRTSKNNNTSIAILDGFSEEINNAIFRKGHRTLNLSSSLIGSGFACEYSLFKSIMAKIKAVGGFDKELEVELIRNDITIGYAHNAMVYDEKVQQPSAFINQRRRWLSAQWIYLKKYFSHSVLHFLKTGNIDYLDKVTQFLLPPRMAALGLLTVLFLFNLMIFLITQSASIINLSIAVGSLLLTLTTTLLLALPKTLWNRHMITGILHLPKGFILMIKALLQVKGSNKSFIHTPHGIIK
ncbi:MAG: glycosyltransferase family 2 protein [Bacteroidales bacterium]|nr:glycosyltransferase family 2 protein [Bacteroidales bacterium]